MEALNISTTLKAGDSYNCDTQQSGLPFVSIIKQKAGLPDTGVQYLKDLETYTAHDRSPAKGP